MSSNDTPLSPECFESLQGIGWEGDLDEMRRSKVDDWDDGELLVNVPEPSATTGPPSTSPGRTPARSRRTPA